MRGIAIGIAALWPCVAAAQPTAQTPSWFHEVPFDAHPFSTSGAVLAALFFTALGYIVFRRRSPPATRTRRNRAPRASEQPARRPPRATFTYTLTIALPAFGTVKIESLRATRKSEWGSFVEQLLETRSRWRGAHLACARVRTLKVARAEVEATDGEMARFAPPLGSYRDGATIEDALVLVRVRIARRGELPLGTDLTSAQRFVGLLAEAPGEVDAIAIASTRPMEAPRALELVEHS